MRIRGQKRKVEPGDMTVEVSRWGGKPVCFPNRLVTSSSELAKMWSRNHDLAARFGLAIQSTLDSKLIFRRIVEKIDPVTAPIDEENTEIPDRRRPVRDRNLVSYTETPISLPVTEQTDLKRIKKTWNSLKEDAVITAPAGAGGSDITLYGKHMARLEPGGWLFDETVNVYMYLLQMHDEKLCRDEPTRLPSHFFNSYMFEKMLEPAKRNSYSYKAVKRWTRKFNNTKGNIFGLDKVFIPVNIGSTHWCLTVAFIRGKRLQYYDSMGGSGRKYLEALKQYLKDEAEKLRKAGTLTDAQVQL